jgi:two-component system response regulator YesN
MSILAETLHTKLIPWSRDNASGRFIVARSKMYASDIPPTVQLVRRKITSNRKIVKNLRLYNNTRGISATWPEAGLNEVNKIKLACVVDGSVDYQLGNYAVQCGSGHFIFIPSGMPHPDGSQSYVDAEKSTFCDVLFFELHLNAVECWVSHRDEQGRKQASKYLILNEHMTSLFRTLAEEILSGEEKSTLIGGELLHTFFIMLEREAEAGRLQPVRSRAIPWAQEEKSDHLKKGTFAKRLEHYVQANLHKPLTLEIASRDMFLSRTQFTRMVRRETGKSFREILTSHRIREAKVLLRDSQWIVSTVAYMVGFNSASHFRTFFRKNTGQTPTEFRIGTIKKVKR